MEQPENLPATCNLKPIEENEIKNISGKELNKEEPKTAKDSDTMKANEQQDQALTKPNPLIQTGGESDRAPDLQGTLTDASETVPNLEKSKADLEVSENIIEKNVENDENFLSNSSTAENKSNGTSNNNSNMEQNIPDGIESSVASLPFFIEPAPKDDQSSEESYNSSETDSDSEVDHNAKDTQDVQPEVNIQKLLEKTGLEAIAAQYHSNTESEDESSNSIEVVGESIHNHRGANMIISSDSDSDIEIVNHVTAPSKIIEIEDDEDENSGKPKGPVRAKGELLLDELPPIQDLYITVPEEECVELGKVHSIVEQLVLVDSIPGTAALDLDTVLFLEKGNKVLGEVFDVIGQVCNPLYCVRFNTNKQIKEKGIEIGQTVYVAPRTEHTHFIILNNLTSIRGSDASWEDDVEPPEKHLDYSDDEEERSARRAAKNRKQQGEEVDVVKKQRPASRPQQSQQNRDSRQRYPRHQQQYQSSSSGYTPNQMSQTSSFQYNTNNTTWHANYSCPPTFYPNPYSRFPTANSRPQYTPPAYSQPQFSPPSNNRIQFMSPHRENSQLSPQGNSSYISGHSQFGSEYPQPHFITPGQSNMPFIPSNPNSQFVSSNSPAPHYPGNPNYVYHTLFPPPPPPPRH